MLEHESDRPDEQLLKRIAERITTEMIQIGLLCTSMLALGFQYGSGYAGNLAYRSFQQSNGWMSKLGLAETPAWIETVTTANQTALIIAALALSGVLLIEYLDQD